MWISSTECLHGWFPEWRCSDIIAQIHARQHIQSVRGGPGQCRGLSDLISDQNKKWLIGLINDHQFVSIFLITNSLKGLITLFFRSCICGSFRGQPTAPICSAKIRRIGARVHGHRPQCAAAGNDQFPANQRGGTCQGDLWSDPNLNKFDRSDFGSMGQLWHSLLNDHSLTGSNQLRTVCGSAKWRW